MRVYQEKRLRFNTTWMCSVDGKLHEIHMKILHAHIKDEGDRERDKPK